MYAEIHAVDEDRVDSPGKTTWVNTDNFQLSVGKPPATHLGDPKRFLELTAEASVEIGTGERGGEGIRVIHRKLTLQLLEDDIQSIIHFALSHGLAGSQLKNHIRLAQEHLSYIARSMNVRLTRRSSRTRRKQRVG